MEVAMYGRAVVWVSLMLGLGCAREGDTNVTNVLPESPDVAAVQPASGPTAGGTTVTLTGSAFAGGATVAFGAIAGTGVNVTSSTTLTVVTPAGAAGPVVVTVRNPDGRAGALGAGFTYLGPPAVTGLAPGNGTLNGGTLVTVTGTGFQSGATVTFDTGAATAVTVLSATALTARTPAHAPGAVTVTVGNPDGQSGSLASAYTYNANAPPVVTATLPAGSTLMVGETCSFTVTVTDPDGDAVSLRLLNPPPLLEMSPALAVASPATRTVDWIVPMEAVGLHRLLFRAEQAGGTPVFLAVPLQVLGTANPSYVLTADVTGDGILDVVTAATLADVGGTANVGAIYVFAGATTPSGTPTARLTVSSAVAGDALGAMGGSSAGLFCVDVTGDGTLDVVVGARGADVGGTVNAGAIYVFAGGSGLTTTGTPTAVCTVSSPTASDDLGRVFPGQGIVFADVTGDGTTDIVAGAYLADIGGTADTGAVYVWAGGTGLSGGVTPTATLTVSGAVASDRLGSISSLGESQGLWCEDVTGDGTADVVAGAYLADVGGTSNTGAIYVWAGGSGLTGAVSPTATLRVNGAVASDQLCSMGTTGQGLWCVDVTGDGTRDVVAGATAADVGGTTDTGAIYVWAGGTTLTGTVSPTATLTVPSAVAGDGLGGIIIGLGLRCVDVTGTGTLDIVAGAASADVGGTANVGALYVWAGGTGLTGSVSPTATLTVTGAAANDRLGHIPTGQGILCADVSGDGRLDLVVGAAWADVGGVADVGAIYVWAGGAGLTGSVAPTATLTVTGAITLDRLGDTGTGQGVQAVDVTGDGIADVVAGTNIANVGAVTDTGAIYVWAGGSGLAGAQAPTATLRVPGATASDQLGVSQNQGILCADVTGDGIRDVVAAAPFANIGGVVDPGAVYVWAGGTALGGTVSPSATLVVSGAVANDLLGDATGQSLRCLDVTGDGILDVVSGSMDADVGAVVDAGACYLWAGGSALTGTVAPLVAITIAGTVANDHLCNSGSGQGIVGADITGDGVPDLVIGAVDADQGGVVDAGRLAVRRGGNLLSSATLLLGASAPTTGDRLGN